MLKHFIRRLATLFALVQLAGYANSFGPIVEPSASGEPYRPEVSVHDQRMVLLKGSATVTNYRISTSVYGVAKPGSGSKYTHAFC